ncbi:hypothetical protein F5888DRAFT_1635242 [Russula emetica]|nr:hypothetical protein F5888DRAFT_1635242 [Russula emetica]
MDATTPYTFNPALQAGQHTLQRSLISTLQYSVPDPDDKGWRMWHYELTDPIGDSEALLISRDSPTTHFHKLCIPIMHDVYHYSSPIRIALTPIPDASLAIERSITHIPLGYAGFRTQATSPVDALCNSTNPDNTVWVFQVWNRTFGMVHGTLFSTHYSLLWNATWSLLMRHIERDAFGTRRHSDLIMEIVKVIDGYNPNLDRTVLIFEIKSSCHWVECGKKEALIQHIGHQADVAFSELRTAGEKIYWIGAIGPRWIYGEIQEGHPRPLIEWHDVTHDEASYRDFLNLVELVASLVGDGQA